MTPDSPSTPPVPFVTTPLTLVTPPPLAPIPIYLPAHQPHFISGPPGGGKTCLTATMVMRFLMGAPIFDRQVTRPPFVGIIAADRPWDDTRQWYEKAGCGDIPHFSVVDSALSLRQLEKHDQLLHILETIILSDLKAPRNSLIIIDPISLWAGGDMNRYKLVYLALLGLNRLCISLGITIIGLAHTSKQKGDIKERYTRPQDRINGSAALLGCSGTQMALETPDQTDSPFYRFTWAPHHAPAESFELDRDPASGLFIPAILTQYPDTLALLPGPTDEPITPAAILRLVTTAGQDISRSSLFRLLDQWTAAELVRKSGRGLYQRTT
jgi:hypothetical protein